jgi:arylformamidase
MKLVDISRPLYTGAPHWPKDTPTEFKLAARMADGLPCNVGRLTLSVHNGTHVDAPFHFTPHGSAIESLPLEHFVGPARVIDARGHPTLTESLFKGLTAADFAAAPRILFRTDTWSDPRRFPTAWPLLARSLPAWLAAHGVKLIGLDVPSVDELTSRDLAIHRLLDDVNILILESLDLRSILPGVYELIALPLKLPGADASPVRAILRYLAETASRPPLP